MSPEWEDHVRRLSRACEHAPKTHITFLGTVLLAKATDPAVDVFALKVSAGTPGAYYARNLATAVLVPGAWEFRIHLGVTGREPLNNQPYFRDPVVSRDMTVSAGGREPLGVVCDLLEILSPIESRETLLRALASFIKIRRDYLYEAPPYTPLRPGVTQTDFWQLIRDFVAEDSEGGRRAQAVAAGLLDLVDGPEWVKTGRINDPDRHFSGDVALLRPDGSPHTVFEVRDKPVTDSDVRIFLERVAGTGISRVGVIAVSPDQTTLDEDTAQRAAVAFDLLAEIFIGWTGSAVECSSGFRANVRTRRTKPMLTSTTVSSLWSVQPKFNKLGAPWGETTPPFGIITAALTLRHSSPSKRLESIGVPCLRRLASSQGLAV